MARLFSSRILVALLLFTSLTCLTLNFIPVEINWYGDKGHSGEKFDPRLVHEVRTVDQLLLRADQKAQQQGVAQGSLGYSLVLLDLVEERFRHGYSSYTLSHNWIAALSGALHKEWAAVVIPDDILRSPNAACSQQCIVMMEAMRRKGFDVRKVLFPTHFAFEARIGQSWYFFDPDVEPNVSEKNISDVATISNTHDLKGLYDGVMDRKQLTATFDNYRIGEVNAPTAPNAARFHYFAFWLSKFSFLLPLALLPFVLRSRKKRLNSATPVVSFNLRTVPRAIKQRMLP